MTAAARVADYLLDLAKRHGIATPIDLSLSRKGMADHLDLSVEPVCRALSQFAEARLIAIPNVRQIEITDAAALNAIAHSEC